MRAARETPNWFYFKPHPKTPPRHWTGAAASPLICCEHSGWYVGVRSVKLWYHTDQWVSEDWAWKSTTGDQLLFFFSQLHFKLCNKKQNKSPKMWGNLRLHVLIADIYPKHHLQKLPEIRVRQKHNGPSWQLIYCSHGNYGCQQLWVHFGRH